MVDLHECSIRLWWFLEIGVNVSANFMALVSVFLLWMDRDLGVIVKLLNHFITSSVIFHWFNFVSIIVLLFIVSSLVLVNLLNGDLVGFISLQFILFGKSCLWSLIVTNDGFCLIFYFTFYIVFLINWKISSFNLLIVFGFDCLLSDVIWWFFVFWCYILDVTKSPFNRFTKTKLDTINKRTIIKIKLS